MSSSSRRNRWARRAVPATLVCLVALLAPLPAFDFVETSFGVAVPLPSMAPAGAAELGTMVAQSDTPLGADRVHGTSTGTEGFSSIGVTLDEAPDDPVLVRVREDGTWSEWIELEVELDGGPDLGSAEAANAAPVVTEPLWVDGADGFQVSLGAGDASGAEVALVREEQRRVITEATPLAGASAPFAVGLRSQWGARSATPGTSATGGLQLAVVHHTATSTSYTAAQVPSILRSMQAYHMDHNGWSDLGYNFVVDKFGGIWEGRAGGLDKPIIGAHAMGFNTGSVGVSVIGDYSATAPTSASLSAVSTVIGWRLWVDGVRPDGQVTMTSRGSTSIPAGTVVTLPRVVGHRQVGATGCPGSIQNSLPWIRSRATADYLAREARRNPVGSLDEVRVDGDRITVRGWAKDPDTDDPVQVHISVNRIWRVVTADELRPDVAIARPGYGDRRGYSLVTGQLEGGDSRVCAYAINQSRGTANTLLGCSDVVVK